MKVKMISVEYERDAALRRGDGMTKHGYEMAKGILKGQLGDASGVELIAEAYCPGMAEQTTLLREALGFADTIYEHRSKLRTGLYGEEGCALVDLAIVMQERLKLALAQIDAALEGDDGG